MRTSQAGLALVRRTRPDGATEYLTQWSDTWKRLALVGGHVEPGESFRACCVREVGEELGLADGTDFRVAEGSVTPTCEYRAVSGSAGVETLYGSNCTSPSSSPPGRRRRSMPTRRTGG